MRRIERECQAKRCRQVVWLMRLGSLFLKAAWGGGGIVVFMDHEGIRLSQCTYTHVHAHVLLAHTRTLAILINTRENCCIDNSKVCKRINSVCVRVLCLISCA